MNEAKSDTLILTLATSGRRLPVLYLSGEEGISRPFQLRATVRRDPDPGEMVGAAASLTIAAGGLERRLTGVIAEAREDAPDSVDLELVPVLALTPAGDGATAGLTLGNAIDSLLDGLSGWRRELPEAVSRKQARALPPAGSGDSVLDRVALLLAGTDAVFVFDDATGELIVRSLEPANRRRAARRGSSIEGRDGVPGVLAVSRRRRAVVDSRGRPPRPVTVFAGQTDLADLRPGATLAIDVAAPDGGTAPEEIRLLRLRHSALSLDGKTLAYTNQFIAGRPGEPMLPPAEIERGARSLGPATAPMRNRAPESDGRPGPMLEPIAASSQTGPWAKLMVPNPTNPEATSYLRLGGADTATEDQFRFRTDPGGGTVAAPGLGIYTYTDGDRIEQIKGKFSQIVQTKSPWSTSGQWGFKREADPATQTTVTQYQWGNTIFKEDTIGPDGANWRETSRSYALIDTFQMGDKQSFYFGYQFDGSAAIKVSASMGAKFAADASLLNASATYGYKLSYSKEAEIKIAKSSDEDLAGVKSITTSGFRVVIADPVDKAAYEVSSKVVHAAVAGVTAVVGTLTAAAGITGGAGDVKAARIVSYAAAGAAATAATVAMIAFTRAQKAKKALAPVSSTEQLQVDKDKILLSCGRSSLLLKKDGNVLLKGLNVRIIGTNQTLTKAGQNEISIIGGGLNIKSSDVKISSPNITGTGKLTVPTIVSSGGQLGSPTAGPPVAAATASVTAAATANTAQTTGMLASLVGWLMRPRS